ncbi:hypothetical protein V9T40_004510 [Parthenolecanium corni]|uniref:Uncharacterized protein n=1 Tax=Parthenolecanium corni TaxID=536013 RepID=A0AAN9TSW0_9HEMI
MKNILEKLERYESKVVANSGHPSRVDRLGGIDQGIGLIETTPTRKGIGTAQSPPKIAGLFPPVMSHFSAGCLNFRLDVSFYVQLVKFSAGCLIFRLDVSFFGWMSHFTSSRLNFRLDVSFFGWMSQFSAGCLILRPAG